MLAKKGLLNIQRRQLILPAQDQGQEAPSWDWNKVSEEDCQAVGGECIKRSAQEADISQTSEWVFMSSLRKSHSWVQTQVAVCLHQIGKWLLCMTDSPAINALYIH